MTFSLPEKKTVPEHQADAFLSQTNPVSGTLYTVLDTTKNVRIISIAAWVTWSTTQPTPLDVVITIDGQTIIFSTTNPVSVTPYVAALYPSQAEVGQFLRAETDTLALFRLPFSIEGRSVKVEARITWATTQPTPLACRVKYAKY